MSSLGVLNTYIGVVANDTQVEYCPVIEQSLNVYKVTVDKFTTWVKENSFGKNFVFIVNDNLTLKILLTRLSDIDFVYLPNFINGIISPSLYKKHVMAEFHAKLNELNYQITGNFTGAKLVVELFKKTTDLDYLLSAKQARDSVYSRQVGMPVYNMPVRN